MGGKLEDLEFKHHVLFKPGPGVYENDKLKTIPSMKFGTGQRGDLETLKEQNHKPGPDKYDADPTRIQTAAPKFGFGTS